MKCRLHPQVETDLKCSKCDAPICPRCLVQTPVGARCPDCAKLSKLPTYQLAIIDYLKAAGTGLGMAIACGIAWALVEWLVRFFYLNLLLAAGAGYIIGEVISRSVNRKRGTRLAVIAGASLVASYLVSLFLPWGLGFGLLDLLAVALGVFIAVTRLR